MVQQRLPIVSSDDGAWGTILNQYLKKEHYDDATDNAANGGHQHITLRPGTTVAGTAPMKLSSGPLLTSPEEGAFEYLNGLLYYTVVQNAALTRKVMLMVDGSSGAGGDLFYVGSNLELALLHAGGTNQVLTIVGGVPTWAAPSGGGSGVTRSVLNISTATTAGAITATDYVYNVSGTTTLTLPTAVSNTNRYTVTNTGSNVVTVATTSSQTIDGSVSAAMPIANMSLDFVSNGSNWIVQ
ncbi:MAG: hypothetical protein JWO99_595 [Candidatus Saccharibacteria bacterium]|nr:hypothetical protein [Candidatus Saccharibacteria bacterium]